LTAVMSGQVQVYFSTLPPSLELIRAGKLRPLGVTTAARSEVLSQVIAVNEFVPNYEASLWLGLAAPKGTAPEIIAKLNKDVNAGLADSQLKARLTSLGVEVYASTPAEFSQHIALETAKWGKVIRAANIKAE